MIHKQDGASKIKALTAPANHYRTKCGIYAEYKKQSILWLDVTCKRCLILRPEGLKRKVADIQSIKRKEILTKVYKELKKLRFNMPQIVAEMNRLRILTETGREVTVSNLQSFATRNNL
jgi:hypothetical protein